MPPSKTKLPSTYTTLLNQVRQTLIQGQRRIEAEKVRIYWETGRLIREHILQNKDRAEYGTEVVKQLSKDLEIEDSSLQRCIQFARIYPKAKISGAHRKLTWSHYTKLLTVRDERERELLEGRSIKHDWSYRELGSRIKASRGNEEPKEEEHPAKQTLLTPIRGQIYTYKLIQRPTLGAGSLEKPLLLDLGFGIFRDVDSRTAGRFEAEQIVESRPKEDSYSLYSTERTARDLYTYQAFVEKVVDGDTLKVRIDLGFETWTRQVLRLRGIDCPEVGTPPTLSPSGLSTPPRVRENAGLRAKAFVQSLIKEASQIIIRSSRSDKYDRYLADIFIPAEDGGEEVFLNNHLLEQGHAVVMP
ncbi:MAG: DUF1016 N-terminal domain-containing protein [Candidatus Omnitrophota bacterium]|nr:DUF1016 N-terminal domain-containing protein [Candidatus Omnitrophota bacterium]